MIFYWKKKGMISNFGADYDIYLIWFRFIYNYGLPGKMKEEDEGITRRTRGLLAGMDEKEKEGITLKLFCFKIIEAFSW